MRTCELLRIECSEHIAADDDDAPDEVVAVADEGGVPPNKHKSNPALTW